MKKNGKPVRLFSAIGFADEEIAETKAETKRKHRATVDTAMVRHDRRCKCGQPAIDDFNLVPRCWACWSLWAHHAHWGRVGIVTTRVNNRSLMTDLDP